MVQQAGCAGLISINLNALRRYYRTLTQRSQNARVAAVVKADGYGLGAALVGHALFEEGCRWFFVATLDEALALRPDLPAADVFVLNGLVPGQEVSAADGGVIPVLNSIPQILRWAAIARLGGRTLPAALQIDTGMTRLGMEPEAFETFALPPRIDVRLVMSHLASADEPASEQSDEQLACFDRVASRFGNIPASLSNSAGAFLHPGFHKTCIRAGIALYGGAQRKPARPWGEFRRHIASPQDQVCDGRKRMKTRATDRLILRRS